MSEERSNYPATRATILDRLQKGDRGALGEIARLYSRPLNKSLQRDLGMSDKDAEDAVQETFALLVNDLDKLASFEIRKEGPRFRSFLYRFAKNVGRNIMKKRKRTISVAEVQDDAAFSAEIDAEISRAVIGYLKSLSESRGPEKKTQRDAAIAMLLFYSCNRSYEEIAAKMKSTPAKVKYLLEAGKKHAREALQGAVWEFAMSEEDFDAMYAAFLKRIDEHLEGVVEKG